MRYAHRAENERQPEVVQDDVLPRKLSVAQLRTQALLDAEQMIKELAEGEKRPNRRYFKEARRIMQHYPTKFEIMHMAEEHPMLDARIAQVKVTQRDHLDMG